MEQLGIEPKLLLAQVVNFAIIVVVLTKLLYKPILAIIAKRKREIEEGLAITKRMTEEEEKLRLRKEKLLADVRREGHEMMESYRKQGKEEEKEILAHAREEADIIVQKGRRDVDALREELTRDIRRQSVSLAAAMTRRLLAKTLTVQDQREILAKQLKELEARSSGLHL